jgi:hypothetical protein
MAAGRGVPMDAVVADFVAGAAILRYCRNLGSNALEPVGMLETV